MTFNAAAAAIGARGEPRGELTAGQLKSTPVGQRMADEALLDRFMWLAGVGWHQWTGKVWEECPEQVVVRAASEWVVEWIQDLIESGADTDTVVKPALRYREHGSVKQLVEVAKTVEGVLCEVKHTDRDGDLLNTPDGIVDLTTGTLQPHDPRRLMTRITGAGYQPGATHPDWDKTLEALDGDDREYLRMRLGQALYGEATPTDELVLCDGGGENGKTALLGTARRAAGTYGVLLSHRVLLGNPDQHPTELMDLRGKRLAYMEETPEERRLDVQRLKTTIGSETITARRIRQDPVEFTPTHSLFIATNHRPVVDGTDWGVWRRLSRVVFPYRYRKPGEPVGGPRDRRGDPGLKRRLRGSAQGQAALAWMVSGAVDYAKRGRVLPDRPTSVQQHVHEWRRESDLLLAFAEDNLVPDPDGVILATDLLDAFVGWLETHGHPKSWTERTLAARLTGHSVLRERAPGIEKVKRRTATKIAEGHLVKPPHLLEWRPPEVAWMWFGVRFRSADDLDDCWNTQARTPRSEQGVPPVPTGRDNSQDETPRAVIPDRWNARNTPPSCDCTPGRPLGADQLKWWRMTQEWTCKRCGNPVTQEVLPS